MTASKNSIGILTLLIIHLIWFWVPLLYGFEWMNLSPLLIVLSCFIVGFFHPTIDTRFVTYATIIFIAGFVLSAVGAHTGRIFGPFFFGRNLGFQLWDTPLVMGLFWLLLSYTTAITASFICQKNAGLNRPMVRVLLASILMLVIALLLEQIASGIDFWFWKYQHAPLQNYTAWFVFACAFNFLFQQLEVDAGNKLAPWFLFLFMLLLLSLNLLPAYAFSK
jgi:hypothetical protein